MVMWATDFPEHFVHRQSGLAFDYELNGENSVNKHSNQ